MQTMERVDLATPRHARRRRRAAPPREVQRLTAGFNRMLDRLEEERREAGRAVLRAQEQERSRIAQDLHDEVNQALTAILLRLEATTSDAPPALRAELQETKRLATQAMEELLHLARQLRPTALDDHGLIPALALAGRATSASAPASARRFHRHGDVADAHRRGAARASTASRRRACPTSPSTRAPARVDVELSFVGRTVLRIRDDGRGFDHGPRRQRRARPASASPACASARCWSAATSTSSPRPARAPPSN